MVMKGICHYKLTKVCAGLLPLALVLVVAACGSKLDYVPEKKHYLVGSTPNIGLFHQDRQQDQTGAAFRVKQMSIDEDNSNLLGRIYIDNQFTVGREEPLRIDITKDRSFYKASTPLFYSSEDGRQSANLIVSSDKGREVIAGVEFTMDLDVFSGKKRHKKR